MSTLHHESIFETILDEVCEEFGIEYDPMGDPDVNHVIDEMVMERFLSMGGYPILGIVKAWVSNAFVEALRQFKWS